MFFRVASGTFLRTYVGLYVGVLLTDLNKQCYVEDHRGLGGNILIRLDHGAFVGLI